MTEIHCDFCKEPIKVEIVQQLTITLNQCARPGAGYNYPTQPYPLKAYDICPECAALARNCREDMKPNLYPMPPKK